MYQFSSDFGMFKSDFYFQVIRDLAFKTCFIFPRLSPIACFSRLESIAVFPTLGISYIFAAHGIDLYGSLVRLRLHFFCTWHRIPCFPRFASVYKFPRLSAGMAAVICQFLALAIGFIFPAFTIGYAFSALGISC